MRSTLGRLIVIATLAATCSLALADPPQLPHFASLRSDKAYLREGPSYANRILWVYKRKGYPFQVLSAYDTWRHVKDPDGVTGWMSASMLTDARTVLVLGHARVTVRSEPAPAAAAVAFAEPGVVAKLRACKPRFCRIAAEGIDGWIDKQIIWGVGVGEVFD